MLSPGASVVSQDGSGYVTPQEQEFRIDAANLSFVSPIHRSSLNISTISQVIFSPFGKVPVDREVQTIFEKELSGVFTLLNSGQELTPEAFNEIGQHLRAFLRSCVAETQHNSSHRLDMGPAMERFSQKLQETLTTFVTRAEFIEALQSFQSHRQRFTIFTALLAELFIDPISNLSFEAVEGENEDRVLEQMGCFFSITYQAFENFYGLMENQVVQCLRVETDIESQGGVIKDAQLTSASAQIEEVRQYEFAAACRASIERVMKQEIKQLDTVRILISDEMQDNDNVTAITHKSSKWPWQVRVLIFMDIAAFFSIPLAAAFSDPACQKLTDYAWNNSWHQINSVPGDFHCDSMSIQEKAGMGFLAVGQFLLGQGVLGGLGFALKKVVGSCCSLGRRSSSAIDVPTLNKPLLESNGHS